MARIYIKNFGPIGEGCIENKGWIDFAKVTVFTGPQGSGKSTIAKVFSFFSWLEKALTRGDQRESSWRNKKKFPREFNDFHNVSEYFKDKTDLRYQGDSYSFTWSNGAFDIVKASSDNVESYLMPKIMYVPAERNFMSVIEAVDQVKNIPLSLKVMTREFLNACQCYADGIDFPLDGFSFKYDNLNRIGKIVIKDAGEVRLSAASSGLQSMTPLFLVSEYLWNQMTEEKDASRSMSLQMYRQVLEDIFDDKTADELPEAIRQALSQYNSALNKRFINIVEEPEQNLFPESQGKLLFKLLEYARGNEKYKDNELIITTHSPYIIRCLSLATSATEKKNLTLSEMNLQSGLTERSLIDKDDVFIYETFRNGIIHKRKSDGSYLSDQNILHKKYEELAEERQKLEVWRDGQYPDD